MKKIITSVLSDEEISAFFDIEYLDDGTISLSNYTGNYTDIKIPKKKYNGTKITEIGDEAFQYCSSLTTIDCSNVTTIGDYAFKECDSLTTIDCPNVNLIGSYAFDACTSLTTINCPNVTRIGEGAFSECTSLESIEVDEDNPNFCSEDGVLFNKDKTELICYPAGKKETSYTVPESVETIDNGAFRYCHSLTEIDCSSVTSIGMGAFFNCTSLTEIDCKNVISIGGFAFALCDSLTKIDCPKVEYIGYCAFIDCTSLKNLPTE